MPLAALIQKRDQINTDIDAALRNAGNCELSLFYTRQMRPLFEELRSVETRLRTVEIGLRMWAARTLTSISEAHCSEVCRRESALMIALLQGGPEHSPATADHLHALTHDFAEVARNRTSKGFFDHYIPRLKMLIKERDLLQTRFETTLERRQNSTIRGTDRVAKSYREFSQSQEVLGEISNLDKFFRKWIIAALEASREGDRQANHLIAATLRFGLTLTLPTLTSLRRLAADTSHMLGASHTSELLQIIS